MEARQHLFCVRLVEACPPSELFTPECAAFQLAVATLDAFPLGDPHLREALPLLIHRPRTEA